MRKNRKKQNMNLTKMVLNTSLALAVTVSITGSVFAAPSSCNLPVPNSVNGANLKYSSGLTINNTGNLDTATQTNAANAANSSCKLNVDVGTTVNSVADIGYNTFNIGKNKTVNFNFGASGQAALNRVTQTGDKYASKILGNITQSGNGGAVFLINPNGVLFGAKSKVNVNSLTVSTLDLVPDETIQTLNLARGTNAPRGILFEKGAQINASQGAVFVANGILDKGAKITSELGNVQLITGDAVTISYSDNFAANQIFPEDVTPSTTTPDQVIYPNGQINKNNAISIKGGIIKGNNVEIIARINKTLSSPLAQIVNIDGVINASKVDNTGGSIGIFADNTATTGNNNAVGININTNLKAAADIGLQANQIVAKDITAGRTIRLFGDTIKTYRLRAGENVFIGQNVFDSVLTPALSTIITSITAGNDIELISQSGSVGNLTAGNDITVTSISGVQNILRIGKIKAGHDAFIGAQGTQIKTGNICAGNDAVLDAFDGTITAGNVSAGRDVTVIGDVNGHADTKNIFAGRNVLVGGFNLGAANVGNIQAKGDVTLTAAEGNASAGNVCAGNNVNVDEFAATFSAGNIKAGNDMNVTMLDSSFTAGNIILGGNLTLNITGSTFAVGNIKAGNDVSITEDGGSTVTTGNICAGNDIMFDAEFGSTISTKNLSAGRDVSIRAVNESLIDVDNIFAGRDITLRGFLSGKTIANDIKAVNNVSLFASEDEVTVHNIQAGNNVILDAFQGEINTNNIKAGNDVNITAQLLGTINTGDICAGNNVTLSESEDGTITTGKISAGGEIITVEETP